MIILLIHFSGEIPMLKSQKIELSKSCEALEQVIL